MPVGDELVGVDREDVRRLVVERPVDQLLARTAFVVVEARVLVPLNGELDRDALVQPLCCPVVGAVVDHHDEVAELEQMLDARLEVAALLVADDHARDELHAGTFAHQSQ